MDGCPVYLLGNEQYFSRPGLYGDVYGDFGDNLERFVFLCRGALELARALDWPAQVVHAHDWQAALAPAYLATRPFDLAPWNPRGNHHYPQSGFPRHLPPPRLLSHRPTPLHGQRGGSRILGQHITAQGRADDRQGHHHGQPTYAGEIQTPELGMGMEGVLQRRSQDLHGIINGVDYSQWSPETDPLLPSTYSAVDLGGKAQCRRALLEAFGLEATQPGGLLMGFIGRLTPPKRGEPHCRGGRGPGGDGGQTGPFGHR